MYFIDTNIFLEVLLKQKHWKECETLFKKIESGAFTCFCSHFSVHSTCVYLQKHLQVQLAKEFIEYLSSIENIIILNTSLEDDHKILDVHERTGLDFDDSLQWHLAKEMGCIGIITFDKDFTKAGLKAILPSEVEVFPAPPAV